ncbi:MAG: hypothetical protein IKH88_08115 [Prevotella sp.]|jgi:hypothetical protein|nr:hypothetical protein [Prevotella sp.]
MKYIIPTSKVLSVNTRHSVLEEEPILATSEEDRPVDPGDYSNKSLEFDDAVDDLFGGKVKY